MVTRSGRVAHAGVDRCRIPATRIVTDAWIRSNSRMSRSEKDKQQTPPGDSRRDPPNEPSRAGARPADWPEEIGGPSGPEPTRYGDWERKGRCSDF